MSDFDFIPGCREFNDIYDFLVSYEIATEREIKLACDLCGMTTETLNSVLFAMTGYRDMQQFIDGEGIENE